MLDCKGVSRLTATTREMSSEVLSPPQWFFGRRACAGSSDWSFLSCQGVRGWKSGLPSWHTEQISAQTWTTRATQSKVDQLREMHGSIAFAESSKYRMCLSNSDMDVHSVGYSSAQSPTNWEFIHGKDPCILCWLSSRFSMALSNENPKGEIQDCALTKETCNNHVHAMYVKFGELAINTLQVQLRRDGGSCLSKIKI